MAPNHTNREARMHVQHDQKSTERHEDMVKNPKGWFSIRLLGHLIVIGLSMGLYGYDNNFAAPLVQLPLFIEKYQGPGLTFTATNLNLLVPVPLVGAALGTFAAPVSLRRLGRKKTMILAYFLLCMPGSFLQLFAPNLAAMVIGRFWNYFGISILTATAPLYLSEMVPAHVRGRAIGLCFAGVAAVGVLATTTVWGTQKLPDRRQYMIPLALQAACPAAFGALTFLLPESPVWLVQQNRMDDAQQVLMAIRNQQPAIVDAEIAMHQAAIDGEASQAGKARFWDILKPANLKRTLTAGALLSASQVGGQILVQTYATVILVQSGVGNAFEITVVISCLQFLGTVLGPFLVDRVGRRPVALVGFSILLVLNVTAGTLGTVGLTTEPMRLELSSVFILFGFFNAASFQSLCFIFPPEIAKPSLREATVAWSVFWSYTTAVITTFAVPQIMNPDAANLGVKTGFVFAGCVLITLVWTYFYVPETMGRTVAEIDEMYRIGLPMNKWRNYRCEVVDTSVQIVNNDGKV